jgi:hypothetical protein
VLYHLGGAHSHLGTIATGPTSALLATTLHLPGVKDGAVGTISDLKVTKLLYSSMAVHVVIIGRTLSADAGAGAGGAAAVAAAAGDDGGSRTGHRMDGTASTATKPTVHVRHKPRDGPCDVPIGSHAVENGGVVFIYHGACTRATMCVELEQLLATADEHDTLLVLSKWYYSPMEKKSAADIRGFEEILSPNEVIC